MTSTEWLYTLSKQRELDKFDLEQAQAMHKAEIIDFATDFAKDYIGFDSVSADPNAASPAEHYYNQIKK
jgi:hypothetical protein